ncbi:MAG: pyridoxal phosphate-dependent aminotransferase [Synergistes sp.]|nr:pyridoxal phosphate-dependent aminotransferase [Synergistes sp.]
MTTKRTFPNKRMADIPMAGGIRDLLMKANEMEQAGRSIIHMEIGAPDFDSPQIAKEAAIDAINAGLTHYTDMAGTFELRSAVAEKFTRENGLKTDADKNVVITCGAMEAVTASLLSLADAGEEIIIPAPFFPAYTDEIKLTGAKPVIVPTAYEDGFKLHAEEIAKAVTPRTAAILLNTPNNPSGSVQTKETLLEIAELAIEKDLWVISDECYEKFIYDGKHTSIASLPGMAERTITVGASSKTWSMTGWRVGWVVAPVSIRHYINKTHQNLTTCANSFAQEGVKKAFEAADNDVAAMIKEYKRRRDMAYDRICGIDGFEAVKPSGAFYIFPKIASLGMKGLEFCEWLLETAGVSCAPGEAFGMPGYIRLAYCRSYEEVEEGMKRIKKAVESL